MTPTLTLTLTLDMLLDMGEAHARTVLLELKQENLQPFYHLSTPGDDMPDALIPCEFEDDYTKDIAVAVAAKVARDIGATMVLFVSEAWMAVLPTGPGHPEPDMTTPPSQRPDRVEIVALVASDGDNVRQRTLKMIRGTDAGNHITALERTFDGGDTITLGGRMIDGIIRPSSTH